MPALPDFPPTLSRLRRAATAGLCGVLMAGCATRPDAPPPAPDTASHPRHAALPPAPPAAPAQPPVAVVVAAPDLSSTAAAELVEMHERVRQLPAAELAKEAARLAELQPTPAVVVELALVLAQQRSNGDLARALFLLDALARATAPDAVAWQPAGRLLAARLSEQRRLEEQVERQSQQLREQQRRIDQLNGQLEALKAIERSLNARPASGAPAPAGPKAP